MTSRTPISPPARERLLSELSQELQMLDDQGLRRSLVSLDAVDGPRVRIQSRTLVNWCSNDYLGLSQHPRVIAAATQAATQWGVGARASRLLAGTTAWHTRLETSLAAWFGADAAIVFPSGFMANLGVLGALLSTEDVVIVDRLAHASLLDAARASRATFKVFRHNDADHAASLLARARTARRRLLVTEGMFSMDGDSSCLADLVVVAEAHDATVYLDDAHGAFVLGQTGRGTPEALGVPHDRLLYMATLGKALGCQGGVVIGPQPLIDILLNRARTFIYATALAVPVAAAAVEALHVLDDEPQLRQRLQVRTTSLHAQLSSLLPMHRFSKPSHIVPVVVGETLRALGLAQDLWEHGHWAPAIRPPTVPNGTARLRLSLTAGHSEDDIHALVLALRAGLATATQHAAVVAGR